MKVKVTQLCPTLCNLMDCSLPGSSVHGIPQEKNTGVGSHSLLQGNLPNPGIKPRIAQLVKKPPAVQETLVRFLGWEDPLQKGEVTYSSSGLEIFMDYLGHGVTKKWA